MTAPSPETLAGRIEELVFEITDLERELRSKRAERDRLQAALNFSMYAPASRRR